MTAENGASVLKEERERDADWLTGLLPLLLISLIYYRLSAAVLELLAVGGYLMASALIARLDRRQPQRLSFARGAVGGFTHGGSAGKKNHAAWHSRPSFKS